MDFSELTKLHDPQLIENLFRIVNRLQLLHLTVEEVAIITAISIMSSGRLTMLLCSNYYHFHYYLIITKHFYYHFNITITSIII